LRQLTTKLAARTRDPIMRPMRRIGFGLVFVLATTTVAAAADITDDEGLRLPLDASACVVHPMRLRDPGACKGVDVNALSTHAMEVDRILHETGSGMRNVALVMWHTDDGFTRLQIVARPATDAPTRDAIAEFVAGVHNGAGSTEPPITRNDDPRVHYDRLTIGGTPAIRYTIDPSPARRLITYAVYGAKATYQLSFEVLPHLGDKGRIFTDALVAKLALPPLTVRQSQRFGQTREQRRASTK
jgi:hypothetical protein